MSMSIAIPAEESKSDKENTAPKKKSSPSNFALCIKNTFIDVIDDDSSPSALKRSASAPPTPRGAHSSPLSPILRVDSLGAWSEASTSSEVATDVEISDDSCGESVASDSGGITLTLAELLPPPPPQAPSRTKLSTSAKAWAPSHRVGMPPDVKSQFSEVLAGAQAALMSCACVQQVGSVQREDTWFLEASCKQADLPSAHSNLALAKQAMLCAAQKSDKIRILGYERTPFAPTSGGFGFSAQLAFVEDEASACWNLMATGACRHRCGCRWQHPTWVVSMHVAMKA